MMDSARARTVGSSSTTRTVVGLAFSDFIALYPLGFENGNHGAKAKFQPSQLFYDFDFTCCTYAAKTQTRKQRPTTNWPFAPIVAYPSRLSCAIYREAAAVSIRRSRCFVARLRKCLARQGPTDLQLCSFDPRFTTAALTAAFAGILPYRSPPVLRDSPAKTV